eukprot:6188481-Pleurochrysis_carterae.AAC.1
MRVCSCVHVCGGGSEGCRVSSSSRGVCVVEAHPLVEAEGGAFERERHRDARKGSERQRLAPAQIDQPHAACAQTRAHAVEASQEPAPCTHK